MSILQKIVARIPFLRHRVMMRQMKEDEKDRQMVSLCNRVIARKQTQLSIEMMNDGKIDWAQLENPNWFGAFVIELFGKKAKEFAGKIKVERAKLRQNTDVKILLVHLPSYHEIGQSCIVCFVKTEGNKVQSYSLEYNSNGIMLICSWDGDIHLNFGSAKDKVDFVKKVYALANNQSTETKSTSFDELDLKHRLAREIGVRYEMLDFYMTKFQNKVHLEMCGIDTSGIDSDIEDVEEWLRYCNWEIEQSLKRMSPEELDKSKNLFNYMLDRDNSD